MIDNNRSLEKDASAALKRWHDIKIQSPTIDKYILVRSAEELEVHLKEYVKYHKQAKKEVREIETRRQDHWDILNKKCSEDPMFRDLWNELIMLLGLEEPNQKTKEQIDNLKTRNQNLLF